MALLVWLTRMVAGVAGVLALVLAAVHAWSGAAHSALVAAVLVGVGERLAVGMRRARRASADGATPSAERSSTGGG